MSNTVSTQMPDKRLRVAVTIDTHVKGWERIAPSSQHDDHPQIGQCEFFLNPKEVIDVDYWIVCANARPKESMRCAPENTLFIAGEPESKKIYPKAFYRQFYRVIDTHLKSEHPRVTLHAPCLSWHVGRNHRLGIFEKGYSELMSMECPTTPQNKISVVCSNAAFTEGQRQRLAFLETLKSILGDKLIHYGRGFQPVDDKLTAIHGFRFHLAMENCQAPHYWTEKISDAYLGWAFPLYIGSPNITDYFPTNSLLELDIQSPAQAAQQIESLLQQPRSKDEQAAVAAGRDLVLTKYNPWVAWASWAEQFYQAKATPEHIQIRSHRAFRPFPRGLIYRLRNYWT